MSMGVTQREGFRDVTAYLSWDHHRLAVLLSDVELRVDAREFESAIDRCREFERGLTRHMRLEEDVLFPLFEARAGLVDGPTAALRAEHREIERAAALLREGLDRHDADAFHDGLSFLRATLQGHNSKEEHILFPTTDVLLTERERLALTERLQLR
jgi:iron-sulfur cluster repair protein YtfE (RIC family)